MTALSVGPADAGTRLDSFLAAAAGISRSAAARLAAEGAVTLNGRIADKNARLRDGDTVCYTLPPPREDVARPQEIPLDIVYEDDFLLVINKPSGMVVHPAAGNPDGTLVNALLHHCAGHLSGIGGVLRPGIVHRIDKDTSGLLVVAKTDEVHRALSADLSCHRIRRIYHALVRGGFDRDEGTVDLPIARHPTDRKKMAVCPPGQGRNAVTHYRVLARYPGITYLSLELETGRTHQIRVHMSALGHPLLGDPVYGGTPSPFERRHAALLHGQCLHAGTLRFRHPVTGQELCFSCGLPENFRRLLAILDAVSPPP